MPKVPRVVLKDYFQTGDKPTQPQFSTMLDSMLNYVDDRDLIGLRVYNPSTEYVPGDFAVYNDQLMKCLTETTGTFNPAAWEVINSFGSVTYVSPWDTQNNEPELQSSVGTKGFYYVVTNASSNPADNTELDGIDDWGTGDWAIFNGSVWQKVANSQAPIPAVNVTYEPSGNLESTNVQDAIDELELTKQPLISIKPPYIPYAFTQTRLAESWLMHTEDGVVVSLKKVIRSEPNGKAQIDFGLSGTEVRLSTAGFNLTESRIFLNAKEATTRSEVINAITNDSSSGAVIKSEGYVNIYGKDSTVALEPGKVKIAQAAHADIILDNGTDTLGRAKITAAENEIVISKNRIRLAASGTELLLRANGESELTSSQLNMNSTAVFLGSVAASRVVVTDAGHKLTASAVSAIELDTLSGVTSPVQDQLDGKLDLTGGAMLGDLTLNADPSVALGAVTKQYADAIQDDLQTEIDAKVSKTGDTMSGLLVLSGDPSAALGAVTKQYADAIQTALQANIDAKVSKTGDTMSGLLVLSADPSAALGAVTKQYADAIQTALQANIDAKVSKDGDTMTGLLLLSADPSAALGAVTKQYADAIQDALETQIDAKVSKDGDTMSGLLVLSADPSAALGAVTKQYADAIQDALETQIDAKVSKDGDTMTGLLVLSGDPAAALGAVTKQYADAIEAALTEDIDGKVSKAGDTMTGALVLSGDPTGALVAAPKQYVDAATKKLFIPLTFNNDVITNSSSFVSIPLQVVIPDASTVYPGTTSITAKLTIDYMTENGPTPAQGEAGLTEWTTASGTPSLVSGSSITMAATLDVWTKATSTSAFSITGNRTYRIIFRKTAGSGGARIRIEAASLSLFYT